MTVEGEDTKLLEKWVIPRAEWKDFPLGAKVRELTDCLGESDEYQLVSAPDDLG